MNSVLIPSERKKHLTAQLVWSAGGCADAGLQSERPYEADQWHMKIKLRFVLPVEHEHQRLQPNEEANFLFSGRLTWIRIK